MSGVEASALDALASLLMEAAQPLSAAELCMRLGGWSRKNLGAALTDLHELDAPVRETEDGFTLELNDSLDAASIRNGFPAAADFDTQVRRVCASTNDCVRAGAGRTLCVAEAQSAGRGRRGQGWRQPFGSGLCFSLSAPAPQGRLDPLALALAVVAAQTLEIAGYTGIGIKWPNDLWARGGKLGGLLVEAEGGTEPRVIVGLGLNVHAAPALAGRKTIALADLGPPPVRNRLIAALALALAEGLARYDAEGFVSFAHAFAAFDVLADHEVTLKARDREFHGIARGIDGCGALVLDTPDGRFGHTAGEATLGSWNA